jgi:cytochrome c oxidase subunit IV
MLVLDGAQISRAPFIVLMLIAMAVKATLITGNFMHLRSEQAGIIMTVVIGLFVCGLVLYVPDAARIHEMVNGR